MTKRQHVHVGTSGWHYGHWKGPFYPKSIASEDFLKFYCQKFNTAEINNSFYKLPETTTLKAWKDAVPSHFIFAAKASRYITHMKKLKDPEVSLAKFMERITDLEEKLGPILFQLPPPLVFQSGAAAGFSGGSSGKLPLCLGIPRPALD